MKNILVPTDFSPEAHYAFEVALQLAKRTGGSVTLLHVVEMPETTHMVTTGGALHGNSIDDIFMVKLLEVIKHRMHSLMAEAARIAEGVPVYEVLETDRVGASILKVIDDRGSDLVVMGAQGHSAWEHFFAGSNTERLVRLAPCPVLAVKHPVPHFDVQHLVFPSDFSSEADRAVPGLLRVLEIFPQARLRLLTVVSGSADHVEAVDRIHAFANRHQLTQYEPVVYEAPNASTGIPRFTQESPTDLVVMPTHGRTGLSHYLQASIAESVATHAWPPVLTYHLQ